MIPAVKQFIERFAERCEDKGRNLKQGSLPSTAMGRRMIDAVLWPSDLFKCVMYYKSEFGRTPRLLRPRTFNEKIQQAKLFDRKPRYAMYADKLAAHDYLSEKVGDKYLPKLFWCGEDLLDARSVDLPEKFVIKANHSWETVIFVHHRDSFDWDGAAITTAEWLKQDHSLVAGEWEYRWIKPRLLIEEFLNGKEGVPPSDYKFFCFHGRVEFIAVDATRHDDPHSSYFTRDFNPLPFTYSYPQIEGDISAPDCLEEMVRMAEKIAHGEKFLRVDMYDVDGPVCGELVTHPTSGFDPFEPPEYDEFYGSKI